MFNFVVMYVYKRTLNIKNTLFYVNSMCIVYVLKLIIIKCVKNDVSVLKITIEPCVLIASE